MSLFAAVNEEYTKWFGRSPPSRSCVAVAFPDKGIQIAADALFLRASHATIGLGRSSRRHVLHVGCVSEWAPVCIGPYAQANTAIESIVWVAGQIPLDPATMELLSTHATGNVEKGGGYEAFGAGATVRELELTASTTTETTSKSSYSLHLRRCLALCLRHVARVTAPLNSSLKLAISCVVFLDIAGNAYSYSLNNTI